MDRPMILRKINRLAKNVADKIAAGEVVDRPVSIVKELLENAIDAGADSVVVEIRNGGKTYIRVTDNGCGIPEEDLELAFQRHATSKITTDTDLDHIQTLGFRGEALASIAAVSRVEMITKPADRKMGSRICIEGGETSEIAAAGCPDGTTIIVTDLFFNTPARLKFMKKEGTESALIIDFVSKMALAYPAVKIRMVNNGTILFSTNGKGDIYTNILTVFSRQTGDGLMETNVEADNMRLQAWVSSPQNSNSTRKHQIYFVNGRNVVSKVLDAAVTEAYRQRMFEGRYPSAFLFLNLPPEDLDVNIHPNKKEVRFGKEAEIKAFVTDTIREALMGERAIPVIHEDSIRKSTPEKAAAVFRRESEKSPAEKPKQEDIRTLLSTLREAERAKDPENKFLIPVNTEKETICEQVAAYGTAEEPKPVPKSPRPFDPSSIRLMGSVFASYLAGTDDQFFYLVDQHAAHERIMFERLTLREEQEQLQRQILLSGFLTEVSPSIKSREAEWLPALRNMGFLAEEFGNRSYAIKEIPMFLTLAEAKEFIDFFFEHAEEAGSMKDPRQIEKVIMRSCKSAVKANRLLAPEEATQLMKDLSCCRNPFSCPHGRPTIIRLSRYEIEKLFKRV